MAATAATDSPRVSLAHLVAGQPLGRPNNSRRRRRRNEELLMPHVLAMCLRPVACQRKWRALYLQPPPPPPPQRTRFSCAGNCRTSARSYKDTHKRADRIRHPSSGSTSSPAKLRKRSAQALGLPWRFLSSNCCAAPSEAKGRRGRRAQVALWGTRDDRFQRLM